MQPSAALVGLSHPKTFGRYLDVNGDGNVDHVHVNGARDGWAKVKGPLQPHVPGCLVKVSSHGARGASRQLFNGSLCLRARPAKQLTKATIGLSSVPKSVANVEVAPGLAVASSDRRAEQVCRCGVVMERTQPYFFFLCSNVPSLNGMGLLCALPPVVDVLLR